MKMNPLGRTGLDVSVVGLGTMTWGEQNSEAEAHQQMDAALAAGVNFFDAAEMYPVPPKAETQGRTEQYIGTWFKARGSRQRVILATKVTGPADSAWIRGGPHPPRAQIAQAVETSLQRLQTDYIDLYQVHWPDRPTNYFGKLGYTAQDNPKAVSIEETLEALDRLVRAGKVRHIGISN